tara:strand:- start:1316 stop:1684 length:369 start_codon:yes stop_codon:yes gene_type:complete
MAFTETTRQAIFNRDNFTCRACGYSNAYGMGLHADHIHAQALGGLDTVENGQCLCVTCNISKGKVAMPSLKIRKPLGIDSKAEFDRVVFENQQVFKATIQDVKAGIKFSKRGKKILNPKGRG